VLILRAVQYDTFARRMVTRSVSEGLGLAVLGDVSSECHFRLREQEKGSGSVGVSRREVANERVVRGKT